VIAEAAPEVARAELPVVASTPAARSWAARCWRVVIALWKLAVGMLVTQTLVGGVLAVGWTYRLVQRSVLRQWWRRSEAALAGESFAEFLAFDEVTKGHAHWPNWIVQQQFRDAVRRAPGEGRWHHIGRCARALVHSLWANVRIGFQGTANTALFLLPAGVLMNFSWYDGWHNSFNKGYEQYAVGMSIGWIGILCFIAAMLYVPLAQAHQAVTGEWRAFYDFRLVWGMVRSRWASCLMLAVLYTLLMVPVTVIRIAPMFFPQAIPGFGDLSHARALKILNDYYFVAALWVFPAYVALRLAAGRIYARGLLAGIQSGRVPAGSLRPFISAQLARLALDRPLNPRRRHVLVRVASSTSVFFLRAAAIVAAVLLWFTVVAQLYIQQFLNYIPAQGWLNHPLVQLPVVRFIPAHLKQPEPL